MNSQGVEAPVCGAPHLRCPRPAVQAAFAVALVDRHGNLLGASASSGLPGEVEVPADTSLRDRDLRSVSVKNGPRAGGRVFPGLGYLGAGEEHAGTGGHLHGEGRSLRQPRAARPRSGGRRSHHRQSGRSLVSQSARRLAGGAVPKVDRCWYLADAEYGCLHPLPSTTLNKRPRTGPRRSWRHVLTSSWEPRNRRSGHRPPDRRLELREWGKRPWHGPLVSSAPNVGGRTIPIVASARNVELRFLLGATILGRP